MNTIIGLGQAGCAIANEFKKHSQYKIYKIDVGLKGKNCFDMPFQDSPEKYEKNHPTIKLRTFLKGIKNNILFITSYGNISGSNLRILEQLKNKKCKITILYVKPDIELLSPEKILQENLVFNVLQEYARSAVFEKVYIVNNFKVASILGNVPLKKYYARLNETIATTIHMINVFNHSDTIIDTFSSPIETARISTFGLYDFENEKEEMFFDLEMPREKKYYYAIPEAIIETDGKLLEKITKQIKDNIEHNKMKISYGVFSTSYEQIYTYCITSSTLIQKNKKNT